MSSPRPIPAMLLFFSLVWLLPALAACASSSRQTLPASPEIQVIEVTRVVEVTRIVEIEKPSLAIAEAIAPTATPTLSYPQLEATRRASEPEVVAPTSTPKPPPTSTPVPTPKIDTNGASFVYLILMAATLQPVVEAMGSLGELFTNPRLLSDEWKSSVAIELVRLRQAHKDASELSPPAPMRSVHEAALKGLKKCDDATYLVASGLDNFDAAMMKQAVNLITECAKDIAAANRLLDKWDTSTSGQDVPGIRGATVNADANLRAGPGTTFDVVGGISAGDALTVVGRNEAGDWYKTADGKWIASFLVNNAPNDLPVTND